MPITKQMITEISEQCPKNNALQRFIENQCQNLLGNDPFSPSQVEKLYGLWNKWHKKFTKNKAKKHHLTAIEIAMIQLGALFAKEETALFFTHFTPEQRALLKLYSANSNEYEAALLGSINKMNLHNLELSLLTALWEESDSIKVRLREVIVKNFDENPVDFIKEHSLATLTFLSTTVLCKTPQMHAFLREYINSKPQPDPEILDKVLQLPLFKNEKTVKELAFSEVPKKNELFVTDDGYLLYAEEHIELFLTLKKFKNPHAVDAARARLSRETINGLLTANSTLEREVFTYLLKFRAAITGFSIKSERLLDSCTYYNNFIETIREEPTLLKKFSENLQARLMGSRIQEALSVVYSNLFEGDCQTKRPLLNIDSTEPLQDQFASKYSRLRITSEKEFFELDVKTAITNETEKPNARPLLLDELDYPLLEQMRNLKKFDPPLHEDFMFAPLFLLHAKAFAAIPRSCFTPGVITHLNSAILQCKVRQSKKAIDTTWLTNEIAIANIVPQQEEEKENDHLSSPFTRPKNGVKNGRSHFPQLAAPDRLSRPNSNSRTTDRLLADERKENKFLSNLLCCFGLCKKKSPKPAATKYGIGNAASHSSQARVVADGGDALENGDQTLELVTSDERRTYHRLGITPQRKE